MHWANSSVEINSEQKLQSSCVLHIPSIFFISIKTLDNTYYTLCEMKNMFSYLSIQRLRKTRNASIGNVCCPQVYAEHLNDF